MEWKDIYTLPIPRRVTINTNLRIFQLKLKNKETLEKNFGKQGTPLFSFCIEEPESPIHFFHSCTKANFVRTQLQYSFQNVSIIPPITPQNTIFGFTDHKVNYDLINHILLIFKYYVYKTRENESLDFKVLKRNIHKIKNIEKQISLNKREK